MKCEIEFLPVGSGSKAGDAIVVRYGEPNAFELMVIDGGTLESGQAVVDHVRSYYGNSTISHVALTHSDIDHASGLRTVLEELPVRSFWLHVPWLHAAAARPYFEDKSKTDEELAAAIRKGFDIVNELVSIAVEKKIAIYEPFSGSTIGPFRILSPARTVYDLLIPQFDNTPAPDQAAIEAQGFWIGKQDTPSALGRFFEAAVAKVQKWVGETWDTEKLRDGGVTTARNETSLVLYGSFELGHALMTGDAGVWALTMAAHSAEQAGLPLRQFSFVQIPHHGSRRNVGPTILNRLLGEKQPETAPTRFSAFVSAPPDDDTHPRKMVLNAFMRRGGRVLATQGNKKVYWGGFPKRDGYVAAEPKTFSTQVEEYD